MPAKNKAGKTDIQEEQLKILKKILAELQTLNANITSTKPNPSMAEADPLPDGGSDEELEEYE